MAALYPETVPAGCGRICYSGCWRYIDVEDNGLGVGVVVPGIALESERDGGQAVAVKFKLDDNLPVSSAAILTSAGHDVDTVTPRRPDRRGRSRCHRYRERLLLPSACTERTYSRWARFAPPGTRTYPSESDPVILGADHPTREDVASAFGPDTHIRDRPKTDVRDLEFCLPSLMVSNCADGMLARTLRDFHDHDPSCAPSGRRPDSGSLGRLL